MSVDPFLLASWLDRWANDPLAVTTLVVAVVGGGFALYRFRFIPSERRRETLHAMQRSFGGSKDARDVVLPTFPPFFALGREAVSEAVEAALPRHADLQGQLRDWPSVVDTAAHEILANEAKFRSLLWAVRAVRGFGKSTAEEAELKRAAEQLVTRLNDFTQLVELNLFTQKDALAQLHRAIASACKAVEPLIWSRLEGRWGLRVLRLMLRAEHYNDAKRIHRTSALVWGRRAGLPTRVLIREPLYRDEFGKLVAAPRLAEMSRIQRAIYHLSSTYAVTRRRYGGLRLRRHRRAEDRLRGWLRFADAAGLDPLDLDGWDMRRVEADLEKYWGASNRDRAAVVA